MSIKFTLYVFLEYTKIIATTGWNGQFLDNTEIIDLNGNCSNSSLPKYPKALNGAMGVYINDFLLICGGERWEGSTDIFTNECQKLSKEGVTFDVFQYMLDKRAWASGTLTNDGFMWVAGGNNVEKGMLASTEVINPSDKIVFSNYDDLPEPVYRHALITLNGTTSFLIGGGLTNDEKSTDKTYYFNHITKNWTIGPKLVNRRRDHIAGLIKDHFTHEEHVVVAGGSNGYYMNSTEILFNGQHDWTRGKNSIIEKHTLFSKWGLALFWYFSILASISMCYLELKKGV